MASSIKKTTIKKTTTTAGTKVGSTTTKAPAALKGKAKVNLEGGGVLSSENGGFEKFSVLHLDLMKKISEYVASINQKVASKLGTESAGDSTNVSAGDSTQKDTPPPLCAGHSTLDLDSVNQKLDSIIKKQAVLLEGIDEIRDSVKAVADYLGDLEAELSLRRSDDL